MWRHVGKIYFPFSKGIFLPISEGDYGYFSFFKKIERKIPK
jgi:hypothetical protein